MKISNRNWVLLIGVVSGLLIFSQNSFADHDFASPEKQEKFIQNKLDRMQKKFSLTDDQRKQVQLIIKENFDQMKVLKEEKQKKIQAVLNDEQKKMWNEKKEKRKHFWNRKK